MKDILNDLFLKEYKIIFKKYKPIKKIGVGLLEMFIPLLDSKTKMYLQ